MKVVFAISMFFALIALVAGSATGANADRMKRGLPPLAPRSIYNPTAIEGTSFV
jgi:hypothetical protein